jgi:serine O-acetyltransferase
MTETSCGINVRVTSGRARLNAYLNADLRYSGESGRWRPRFYVMRRALYYQRVLRHAEYWESRRASPIRNAILAGYKLRLALLGERVGASIPRGTCGPGLSIAHPGSIVINAEARLGARCRISQGVTIGATPAGAPVIGDDVFFGPSSQAIGPVVIGSGATLLPGAVVVADVPERSTVGGVPARVTRTDTPPWHKHLLVIDDGASRSQAEARTHEPGSDQA